MCDSKDVLRTWHPGEGDTVCCSVCGSVCCSVWCRVWCIVWCRVCCRVCCSVCCSVCRSVCRSMCCERTRTQRAAADRMCLFVCSLCVHSLRKVSVSSPSKPHICALVNRPFTVTTDLGFVVFPFFNPFRFLPYLYWVSWWVYGAFSESIASRIMMHRAEIQHAATHTATHCNTNCNTLQHASRSNTKIVQLPESGEERGIMIFIMIWGIMRIKIPPKILHLHGVLKATPKKEDKKESGTEIRLISQLVFERGIMIYENIKILDYLSSSNNRNP